MFSSLVVVVGFWSALVSALNTLGGEQGTCTYTTIWYNSAPELQTSLGQLSSSYSVCNSSSTVASTSTSTAPTATPTCAITPTAPCFYLTGHGFDKIEGRKLGAPNGASEARFDVEPSIWWIDADKHLHVADQFNGVSMTYYIGTDSWWGIRAADAPARYGNDYQPSTCTLLANGNLDCFQHGGINSNVINVWNYVYAQDFRAFYLAHWGTGGGFMSPPITLSYEITTCPALC